MKKKGLVIVCILLMLIVIFAIPLTTHAESWDDILKRLYQREREFLEMRAEHKIMYRMISEIYIKEKGMQSYYDLMMSEKDEEEK